MVRIVKSLSVILMFLFVDSTAGAQSQLTDGQVQAAISVSFRTLCQTVATDDDRSALRQFVIEIDGARKDSGIWNYVTQAPFREAFRDTLMRVDQAFSRGCRNVQLTNQDLRRMLDGYLRNRNQFKLFLDFLRDSQGRYQGVSRNAQEIIKSQAQVSAILIDVDKEFWERVSIYWSVLMPLSQGP